MSWYSDCSTYLYIAELDRQGVDYESIARRIRVETEDVLGEKRQKWHPYTVHQVCKIIGINKRVKLEIDRENKAEGK